MADFGHGTTESSHGESRPLWRVVRESLHASAGQRVEVNGIPQ